MRVVVSKIIQAALPFVEQQLGEPYDKYEIEQDLRMHWEWTGTPFTDIMPEIVKHWSVPADGLFLIECMHHDTHTRCLAFASQEALSAHILSGSSYLNPFTSYVIPIINGQVTRFEVSTASGDTVVKHLFDAPRFDPHRTGCTLRWCT